MSDYIKRDGVMMVLGQSKTLTDGMRSVLMIPSADVVEVVRCKDCKHHEDILFSDDKIVCWAHDVDIVMAKNDYCSYGERKEQDNED